VKAKRGEDRGQSPAQNAGRVPAKPWPRAQLGNASLSLAFLPTGLLGVRELPGGFPILQELFE
jgi:hypothetical protein